MAYIPEEEEGPGGQPTGAGGTVVGGAGRPTTPQGSGSWTNLQAYTQANVPQTAQMTEQIRGGLEAQRGAAEEQIKGSKEAYEADLRSGGKGLEKRRGWVKDVVAGDDPSTPEVETGWYPEETPEGMFSAGKPLAGYDVGGEVRGVVGAYGERVGATSTEQGRLAELRRLQGAGITRGESALNQLLMQTDPGAKSMFEQQRAQAPGLGQQYATTQQDLATRQKALQKMQGALPGELGETLYGGYKDVEGQQKTTYDQALEDIRTRYGTDIGARQADIAGLTPIPSQQEVLNRLAKAGRITAKNFGDELTIEDLKPSEQRLVGETLARYQNQYNQQRDALQAQIDQLNTGMTQDISGTTLTSVDPELEARRAALQRLYEQSGYTPEGV